jgi:hypothetical protein
MAAALLRTAEQPLTATDIAWKLMEAVDIKNASETDAQVVAQGIPRSLLSHNGKGVQNVAEGQPARWELKGVSERMAHANHGIGSKS